MELTLQNPQKDVRLYSTTDETYFAFSVDCGLSVVYLINENDEIMMHVKLS